MSAELAVAPERRPWWRFPGWQMVIAGGLLSVYSYEMVTYGVSVFVPLWARDFGWSFTAISLAFTIRSLANIVTGPTFGWLTDRLGPRIVTFICFTVGGLGLLLTGLVMDQIWHLYLFFSVMACVFLVPAGYFTAWKAMGPWFVRRRALSMGLLTIATLFAVGPVAVPMLSYLSSIFGWRALLTYTGMLGWVMMWLALFYRKHGPEHFGMLPDNDMAPPSASTVRAAQPAGHNFTLGQALRTKGFWGLAALFIAAFFTQGALTPHAVNYLMSVGMGQLAAAAFFGWVVAFSLVGRAIITFGGDRIRNRNAFAFLLLSLKLVGVLIMFAANNVLGAVAGMIIYGLGNAELTLMPIFIGEYFGMKNFATINGFMTSLFTASTLVAPLLAGYLFDTYRSYQLFFGVAAAVLALGLVSLPLFLKRPLAPRTLQPQPSTDRTAAS